MLYSDMNAIEDEAARLRFAIARAARKLNASMALDGLSPSQASALAVVSAIGPMDLPELTAFEGLNPTMTSRIVATLSRRHLLKRMRNPKDLRSVRLVATPAGDELRARIKAHRDDVVAEALAKLTAEDREAIVTALPALENFVVALGWRLPKSQQQDDENGEEWVEIPADESPTS